MNEPRTELRCEHKKHGEIVNGDLEVKCSSHFCGAGSGVIVIHQYDLESGTLKQTRRFRDPQRRR